jgi:hypothetical protein
MILKYVGVSDWCEMPLRTADMPRDYLTHMRASWLITTKGGVG